MKRLLVIGFGLAALIGAFAVVAWPEPMCPCGTKIEAVALYTHEAIKLPLTAFRMQNGDYPTTEQGLAALLKAPKGMEATWNGPYVDDPKHLLDPWGHPYRYRYLGILNHAGPDIWSVGPDGVNGTADDIGNWPDSRH